MVPATKLFPPRTVVKGLLMANPTHYDFRLLFHVGLRQSLPNLSVAGRLFETFLRCDYFQDAWHGLCRRMDLEGVPLRQPDAVQTWFTKAHKEWRSTTVPPNASGLLLDALSDFTTGDWGLAMSLLEN